MRSTRSCSRNGCPKTAVATLTYVYADSTAVVGPLAASAEPHSYDLCERHALGLTAPRGWELVRYAGNFEPPPPTPDDLVALAEAVREAARPVPVREAVPVRDAVPVHEAVPLREDSGARAQLRAAARTGRRRHLRALPPSAC